MWCQNKMAAVWLKRIPRHICISWNKNSIYCYIPHSLKHTNTCNGWTRVFCNRAKTNFHKRNRLPLWRPMCENKPGWFPVLFCPQGDSMWTGSKLWQLFPRKGTISAFVSLQRAFWKEKMYFKYNVSQIQVFKPLLFMWTFYLVGKKGFLNS